MVDAAGGAGTSVSATYGVNSQSLLAKLTYFDPIECFPMDIMHVLFEGVVPHELGLLLGQIIDIKHLFTLDTLNNRISSHPYGYSEVATKPTLIDKESAGIYKIRQSGVSFVCKNLLAL